MYVFFFNDTAATEIYTLSLHDALPICTGGAPRGSPRCLGGEVERRLLRLLCLDDGRRLACVACQERRSEEHTSELQSRLHLVCRLLLEKKKQKSSPICITTPTPTSTAI